MDADLAAVGDRLRAVRHERGLSLGALAAAAGIGKGSLSELENGTRNPTLATLYALAGALGVPLASLLAERTGTTIASPGIHARLLDVATHPDGTTVEVYLLHLDAGAAHRSTPHGAGVTEHLVVTRGRLRAGREGREREAGPAETLSWRSDGAHGYAAVGDDDVDAVLTIRTPGPAPMKAQAETGS